MTNNAPKKYERNRFFDGKKADKSIKYCEDCNRCWETIKLGGSNNVLHYEDFPTYKRKRKKCFICSKK